MVFVFGSLWQESMLEHAIKNRSWSLRFDLNTLGYTYLVDVWEIVKKLLPMKSEHIECVENIWHTNGHSEASFSKLLIIFLI